MSTPVTFETDHIFLQHDLTMSSALNSGMYFFVILKKKILKKYKQYYFDLPKIRVGRARTTKCYVAFVLYG